MVVEEPRLADSSTSPASIFFLREIHQSRARLISESKLSLMNFVNQLSTLSNEPLTRGYFVKWRRHRIICLIRALESYRHIANIVSRLLAQWQVASIARWNAEAWLVMLPRGRRSQRRNENAFSSKSLPQDWMSPPHRSTWHKSAWLCMRRYRQLCAGEGTGEDDDPGDEQSSCHKYQHDPRRFDDDGI